MCCTLSGLAVTLSTLPSSRMTSRKQTSLSMKKIASIFVLNVAPWQAVAVISSCTTGLVTRQQRVVIVTQTRAFSSHPTDARILTGEGQEQISTSTSPEVCFCSTALRHQMLCYDCCTTITRACRSAAELGRLEHLELLYSCL